jgi:two-component system OmpR family response regulator
MKLLLVEDNVSLARALTLALGQAGYVVDVAHAGREADAWLAAHEYDLIVLDLGLPDDDGANVLKRLRGRRIQTPVLILSAREAVDERVRLLNLGADDYLVKTGALDELEARVRALIRRSKGLTEPELVLGRLRLDLNGQRAFLDGNPLELRASEWAALMCLAPRAGRIVAKEQLMRSLYGWEDVNSINAVEKIVSRLRSKLAESDVTIRSVRGLGYLIDKDHAA